MKRHRSEGQMWLATVLIAWMLIGTCPAQQPSFRAGDRVEVDVNMSSTPEYQRWRIGTINKVDLESRGYWVAIEDGATSREVIIPIRTPDQWIRRVAATPASSAENAGTSSASATGPAQGATNQRPSVLPPRPGLGSLRHRHSGRAKAPMRNPRSHRDTSQLGR